MRTCVSQVLEHSWDYVASLFWSRYPNPFSKHVLHEDIIECSLINESSTLYTKRLLVKQGFGRVPFWLRKVLSNRQELMIEESFIDVASRRIITVTRNMGALARYAVVVERCDYIPALHDPSNSTLIERKLSMQSSLTSKVLYPLWVFLKRRYASSAQQSFLGYDYVCQLYSSRPFKCLPHLSLSSSSTSNHLKEFARTKRPRVVMAETNREQHPE